MDNPRFTLSATHLKSQQQASLHLLHDQVWQVGREDGSMRLDKWSIHLDPALSRDHFQASLAGQQLLIEATKNRHPILYEGTAERKFSLAPGQGFTTARLRFVFEQVEAEAPDLLGMTAILSVQINAGAGFGQVFRILSKHCTGRLKAVLLGVESAVLAGEPLSKALARYPETFASAYIAMIEVGEVSDLGRTLERLFLQQVAESQARGRPLADSPRAWAHACLNVAEILDSGASEEKAFAMAGRATTDAGVREALEFLLEQVRITPDASEWKSPSTFPSLLGALITGYQALGKMPAAFKKFAELLPQGDSSETRGSL